jgi:hypothetical protein
MQHFDSGLEHAVEGDQAEEGQRPHGGCPVHPCRLRRACQVIKTPPPVRLVPEQVRGMLWRQRLEPVTHFGGTNELMTRVYDA